LWRINARRVQKFSKEIEILIEEEVASADFTSEAKPGTVNSDQCTPIRVSSKVLSVQVCSPKNRFHYWTLISAFQKKWE
jgi:hypothetical protein